LLKKYLNSISALRQFLTRIPPAFQIFGVEVLENRLNPNLHLERLASGSGGAYASISPEKDAVTEVGRIVTALLETLTQERIPHGTSHTVRKTRMQYSIRNTHMQYKCNTIAICNAHAISRHAILFQ
jgi:hypothetical protein